MKNKNRSKNKKIQQKKGYKNKRKVLRIKTVKKRKSVIGKREK